MDFQQSSGSNAAAAVKKKSRSWALLAERDAQIATLQKQVTLLSTQLASNGNGVKRRHHPLDPTVVKIQDVDPSQLRRGVSLTQQSERMGRVASFTTRNVFNKMSNFDSPHPLVQCFNASLVLVMILDVEFGNK